jgi:hypothetical protein
VLWLSGKTVELGPAPPEGRGSWQAGGCGLPQRGGPPVVPHGAGAQLGLMGGGSLRGRGPVIPP